jgi:hypothetical protein
MQPVSCKAASLQQPIDAADLSESYGSEHPLCLVPQKKMHYAKKKILRHIKLAIHA